jgi:hypothetical protein
LTERCGLAPTARIKRPSQVEGKKPWSVRIERHVVSEVPRGEVDDGPEDLSGSKLNEANQGDAVESRHVIKPAFAAGEVRRNGAM